MTTLELSSAQVNALRLAIGAFDNMFWNMTEDMPDYREYEYAWGVLEQVSDTLDN